MKNLIIFFACLILSFGYAFSQNNPVSLIQYRDSVILNDEERKAAAVWQKNQNTESWKFGAVNPAALDSAVLNIQLPNGATYNISKRTEKKLADGTISWKGKPKNLRGYTNFIISRNRITGELRLGKASYMIYPLSGQLHMIIKLGTNFPDDETEEAYREMEEKSKNSGDRGGNFKRPSENNNGLSDVVPPSECRVRILIAITDDVWDSFFFSGDATAFANLCIENVNTVYSDSEISFRAELARFIRIEFDESGDFLEDLTVFRSMDEIDYAKDYYDADLAVLITESGAGCGRAYTIGSFESDEAFCVVRRDCAISNYSVAHELGHLYGCRHDPYVDPNDEPYDFAHGYVELSEEWRTVMAYNAFCSDNGTNCTRLGYFSNPTVNYEGDPTGTFDENDNAWAHDVSLSDIIELEATLNTKQFLDEVIQEEETADILSNVLVRNLGTYEINSGAAVSWRTGHFFELRPGFWAQPGSRFRTTFTSCTDVEIEDAEDDDPIETVVENDVSPAHLTPLKVNPNPISGVGYIQFSLSESAHITLEILSQSQSLVDRMIDEKYYDEGTYTIPLSTESWPLGIYFCNLYTESVAQSIKLVKLE